MTKKDKVREDGEVGVTFSARIGSGTETVFPEEHSSSPAFSSSSKPTSFLVRDGEKEQLYDNGDVTSNIIPVVEIPPPPGKIKNVDISKNLEKYCSKVITQASEL